MGIANRGQLKRKYKFFTAISVIICSITLQGCSQQFINTSFTNKNQNLIETMPESASAEQLSSIVSMNVTGPDRYLPLIKKYSQEYGIDWVLILAVMNQESRFDHKAVSYMGAYGLMQIMPLTQVELAEKLGVEETSTPRNNIKAGIYHLKWLYGIFGSMPREDRTRTTLAAYNAGLRRILDAQRIASYLGNDPNSWISVREALPFLSKRYYTMHSRIWSDGCPPSGYFRNPKQTIDYVDNIMHSYDDYSLALK
jgi:membrane-bound lytic murein transglycosylase MltF